MSREMMNTIPLPTVGEILQEEFMEPLNISAYRLAHDTMIPVSRVQDIIHARRRITVDTSLRFGRFFGVSDDYFLRLLNDIDIRTLKTAIADELNKIQCAV